MSDRVRNLTLDHQHLPLKSFLRSKAIPFEIESVSRTYVLVDEEEVDARDAKIWGYASLVASEVLCTEKTKPELADWSQKWCVPSVKLTRFAVDRRLAGTGLGTTLLDTAYSLVIGKIMPTIGCKLLVVDSKKDSVGFYKKMGFTMLDTEENRTSEAPVMFIDLSKLAIIDLDMAPE